MARALSAQHTPTPLATALYLGLCLLALALMASAADLVGAPYHSDSVLRSPGRGTPSQRVEETVKPSPPPARKPGPPFQLRSERPSPGGAPSPSRPGLLSALQELAAEGRLAVPSTVAEARDVRTSLSDAGPLALAPEAEPINVRRGSGAPEQQRVDELVTRGVGEVSYGPIPSPPATPDAWHDGLAQAAPGAQAGAARDRPLRG